MRRQPVSVGRAGPSRLLAHDRDAGRREDGEHRGIGHQIDRVLAGDVRATPASVPAHGCQSRGLGIGGRAEQREEIVGTQDRSLPDASGRTSTRVV